MTFWELMGKTHLHNLGNIRFHALRIVTQSGFISEKFGRVYEKERDVFKSECSKWYYVNVYSHGIFEFNKLCKKMCKRNGLPH